MRTKLTGKEFEELILFRARADEKRGLYTLGRYGVMATFREGTWQPIVSLPDFEGALPPFEDGMDKGRQFIFDAKTCSQPSYDMSGGTSKSFENQYKHMQRRAKFGVLCFLLMHYNERTLKTRTDPAFTVLFPIYDSLFWQAYDRGEQKKISREEAKMYGIPVEWNLYSGRAKNETPDLLAAILKLRNEIDNG